MFKTLGRLFTLRPYGSQLLDGMAELWLVLAPLNILSIAFCDAVAWAYFGYTTAPGFAAYVAAGAAGLIVFTLVGSVDAMFVMHDQSRLNRRDSIAIGARIVLVILTFTVTAPFLTQLFFARDIEASIRRQNEQRIATRRGDTAAAFDRRAESLRTQLAQRQGALEKEIAGAGASGRYGRGPTAGAIANEIESLQSAIAATERGRIAELATFDQAPPEVLASRYGVDLVREGPATRARVVAELETSPAFRSTQLTIKAFLVFMFLGLVCLKLFQPESVRIYYSGQLQSAYARWKAGVFDHRLDPHELPDAAGMSAIRFADWYENDQRVRDLTERLKVQEDAVRALEETTRVDLARMSENFANAVKSNDALEQQIATWQRELNVLNAKIADEQQQLDDYRHDLGDDITLRDQQILISSRNRIARSLAEHRTAAADLAPALARATERLDANRAHERRLRDAMAATEKEAAALTVAIQEARQRRLAEILTAS